MKKLIALTLLAVLVGGLTGPASARERFQRSDSDSTGLPFLLVTQLVPATGGQATSVGAAVLLIARRGQVFVKVRGLTGAGGPITDTGALEIDLVVNGSPVVPTPSFPVPIADGNAAVTWTLPVASGDLVEIVAFRILDSGGGDLLRAGGKMGSVRAARFEVHGTIASFAGPCPDTTFEVGGVTVSTNADTRYEDGTCANLADGARVEVKGTVLPDGTHLATKVEFEDD